MKQSSRSSLLARTRAPIVYISIWMFDFGPVKLPGLSRDGDEVAQILDTGPGCSKVGYPPDKSLSRE